MMMIMMMMMMWFVVCADSDTRWHEWYESPLSLADTQTCCGTGLWSVVYSIFDVFYVGISC